MPKKNDLISDEELFEIRKKYQSERTKRLRSDGMSQFNYGTGDFSRFIDDPIKI